MHCSHTGLALSPDPSPLYHFYASEKLGEGLLIAIIIVAVSEIP